MNGAPTRGRTAKLSSHFTLRRVYTNRASFENTQILYSIARAHARAGDWCEALCVLVRRLWRLFPPVRIVSPRVSELIGRCSLAMGYYQTAADSFLRACVEFNSVNGQDGSYYKANMARLLFFVAATSVCEGERYRRAQSYFDNAKALLAGQIPTLRQA